MHFIANWRTKSTVRVHLRWWNRTLEVFYTCVHNFLLSWVNDSMPYLWAMPRKIRKLVCICRLGASFTPGPGPRFGTVTLLIFSQENKIWKPFQSTGVWGLCPPENFRNMTFKSVKLVHFDNYQEFSILADDWVSPGWGYHPIIYHKFSDSRWHYRRDVIASSIIGTGSKMGCWVGTNITPSNVLYCVCINLVHFSLLNNFVLTMKLFVLGTC